MCATGCKSPASLILDIHSLVVRLAAYSGEGTAMQSAVFQLNRVNIVTVSMPLCIGRWNYHLLA
mgnify:CR=1 FL=1